MLKNIFFQCSDDWKMGGKRIGGKVVKKMSIFSMVFSSKIGEKSLGRTHS